MENLTNKGNTNIDEIIIYFKKLLIKWKFQLNLLILEIPITLIG
jgi:hypothetical protein